MCSECYDDHHEYGGVVHQTPETLSRCQTRTGLMPMRTEQYRPTTVSSDENA